jgi:hypothetical protein
MSWPSLSDIRTEVRYHLDEATASLWSDAELTRHINDGEADIAAKTGCYQYVASAVTTANSRLVPFTGYKVRHAEYIPASGPHVGLIFITPKMLGNIPINDGAIPQYCFQWGQNLIVEPMPEAVYNLKLYISTWPGYLMAGNADEPLIPKEFRENLPLFAGAMAFLKAKRPMTSGILYRQYMSSLQLGRQIYTDERADRLQDVMVPYEVSDQPQPQEA